MGLVTSIKTKAGALFIATALVCAQAAHDDWQYSQKLRLNTSSTGANVTSNVSNFAVLVPLTSDQADVFSQANPNGEDIRFSDADGSPLAYEIETWDQSANTATLWVFVPLVDGNSIDDHIFMHWGKSSAVNESNSAAIFQAGNGFLGTWHLNETPSESKDDIKDRTANSIHGTSKNGMSSAQVIAGRIGTGLDFERNSRHYISFAAQDDQDDAFNGKFSTYITISAWVQVESNNIWDPIFMNGYRDWRLLTYSNTGRVHFGLSPTSGEGPLPGTLNSSSSINDGNWHFVAGVYDGSKMYIYIDGQLDAQKNASGNIHNDGEVEVRIGSNSQRTDRWWDGGIDEVRLSNVARGPDWIKLCYENQKDNQTLVEFDASGSGTGGGSSGGGSAGDYVLRTGDVMVDNQSHLDLNGSDLQNAGTVSAQNLEGDGGGITNINPAKINTSSALSGQVLGYNGSNAGWMDVPTSPTAPQIAIPIPRLRGMKFIPLSYLPQGGYTVGDVDNNNPPAPEFISNYPRFEATFTKDVWVDETEVTIGDFYSTMGEVPFYTVVPWAEAPVAYVDWYTAILYCNQRSKIDGFDTVYTYTSQSGSIVQQDVVLQNVAINDDAYGYRLPYEIEWEWIARSWENVNSYYWGESVFNDKYGHIGTFNPTTVARKIPTNDGIYDAIGGVYEWVNDWAAQYPSSNQVDYTGAATGSEKICRGGSFLSPKHDYNWTVTRKKLSPDQHKSDLGFRCVLPVQP
ncbi:MAG: DUF2341 domain-containing protein [Chitinivibrionales bacterium]|nr:DUF2341 domain-containing protein [Chitinivibrionales bacterium]